MDYSSADKYYEKFLDRIRFNPMPESDCIPLREFRDCLNVGVAIHFSRNGHPCFRGTSIIPSAVMRNGFSNDEIQRLFKPPTVSRRRRYRQRINSRLYKERHGAISYPSRQRKNVADFKKIIRLRQEGLTRHEIALRLDIPFQRVRYLIQCYKEK